MDVRAPQGMSYALSEYHVFGYTFLTGGAQLVVDAISYFAGRKADPHDVMASTRHGPHDAYFVDGKTTRESDLQFSSCNVDRLLNLNIQMTVKKETSAEFAAESAPYGFAEVFSIGHFKFVTKKCPAPSSPGVVIIPGAGIPGAGPFGNEARVE